MEKAYSSMFCSQFTINFLTLQFGIISFTNISELHMFIVWAFSTNSENFKNYSSHPLAFTDTPSILSHQSYLISTLEQSEL